MAKTPKMPPWEEPVAGEPKQTVYFNRTGGRGRVCQLVARIDGGRRYRVRLVRTRAGERRERIVPALWFEPPVEDEG